MKDFNEKLSALRAALADEMAELQKVRVESKFRLNEHIDTIELLVAKYDQLIARDDREARVDEDLLENARVEERERVVRRLINLIESCERDAFTVDNVSTMVFEAAKLGKL